MPNQIDSFDVRHSHACSAIQEIEGMGDVSLLSETEDELCLRLVTKYGNRLPRGPEASEFQLELRSLTSAIRRNVAKRRANFFSDRAKLRTESQPTSK